MSNFITFKRWSLRDGAQEGELESLVRGKIVPHFKKLPGCLRLDLLRFADTRSYLALQYWSSRQTWEETTNSKDYADWYRQYEPILERWNELMTFEQEWACEEVEL